MIACSKGASKDAPEAAAPPPAASSAAPAASSAAIVDAAPSAEAAPPPSPKKHLRVLHTGDSMVGGGLSRALGPMFEKDGAKYFRDVIESGTIHEFSQNDHLPKLIASTKPDLILMSLGANHIPNSTDPDKEIGIYVPKLIKRMAVVDCIWIAPPIWKPHQAKFNTWLSEHVAPCKFYDGSNLEIERRADKIHPNEKGGEVWAADFWKFYKGEGAFYADAPSLLPDAGH